jgi:exosortase
MISRIYSQIVYPDAKVNKTRDSARSAWHNFIGLSVIICLLAIPVLKGLWQLWHCGRNFDGMILVPFMCGLILIKNRNEFASSIFKPIKKVLYILPATTGAMLAATAYDLPRISGLFLVFNLLAASMGIFGYSNWKLSVVPLIFLLLMVPPPQGAVDFVTVNLQRFFSLIMETLLSSLSNHFIERNGFEFRFTAPNYLIPLTTECSGIRSLLGFIIISSFLVVFDRHNILTAVFMLLMGIATALVLNFARILITIQLRLSGHEEYATGSYHGLLGLLAFLIGCAALGRLSRFLKPLNQQNQKDNK